VTFARNARYPQPPVGKPDFYEPQAWPADGPSKEEPWLQWPAEPEVAYAHFQAFRDLPPPRRTVENARLVFHGMPYAGEDRQHKDASTWKMQGRKWRWIERARAFDRWKEKTQLEAERDGTLEAWKEMGERHAREAMALQQKALERLRSMNPAELSAAEVRQFLVQAATLERLARGASLQDLARVQREKEQEAAKAGVAVITYVDDWRGDSARRQQRNPNSFYGNGQGALPELTEEDFRGHESAVPPVRTERAPAEGGGGDAQVPLPPSPSGAGRGDAPPGAVHVPRRRAKVAQDHPGDDPGRGGGDPR
jgi:hypothetical protein